MATTATGIKSPLFVPYTGTPDQPDIVTLFSLQGKGPLKFEDEQIVNSLGYSPFNFMPAIYGIQLAVEKIFSEAKQGLCRENSEAGNAFKNLFRRTVQLVPLAGNAALYVYDKIKTHFFIHSQIASQLSCGPAQMGIAFDGKVIAKFSYAQFNRHCTVEHKYDLTTLSYMWTSLLVEAAKKDSTATRHDLALKLARNIQRA